MSGKDGMKQLTRKNVIAQLGVVGGWAMQNYRLCSEPPDSVVCRKSKIVDDSVLLELLLAECHVELFKTVVLRASSNVLHRIDWW